MAVKQVFKRIKYGVKPIVIRKETVKEKAVVENVVPRKKNNKKNEEVMNIDEISRVEQLVQDINEVPQKVKVVKKDRGLIERTESSKIVLTEDNRQVLND